MNFQTNKKDGFTIIEVVLVLAIAGLIFLMVFLALPALQRNQRDTQRKADLSRLQTAVNNHQTNNRGKLPTDDSGWRSLVDKYVLAGDDVFADPTGADYNVTTTTTLGSEFSSELPNILVTVGSTCDGETVKSGQGSRKVALQMVLEGGGIACVNN